MRAEWGCGSGGGCFVEPAHTRRLQRGLGALVDHFDQCGEGFYTLANINGCVYESIPLCTISSWYCRLVGGLTHPPGGRLCWMGGWVVPRVWVVVTVCPPPAHQPPGSLQSPLSGDTSLTNSVLRRFFLQGSHTTPTKCVANLNPIFTSNSSTKHQVQRIVWIWTVCLWIQIGIWAAREIKFARKKKKRRKRCQSFWGKAVAGPERRRGDEQRWKNKELKKRAEVKTMKKLTNNS